MIDTIGKRAKKNPLAKKNPPYFSGSESGNSETEQKNPPLPFRAGWSPVGGPTGSHPEARNRKKTFKTLGEINNSGKRWDL